MSIWKLVSGILCIIISGVVTFQSFAAGLYNVLDGNDEISGTAGLIVATFLLTGGIVSIVIHKSKGIGGDIALIVVFTLAALFGFVLHGNYEDLIVWSFWCLICSILATVSLIIKASRKKVD